MISPSSGGSFWAGAPSNAPAPLWPSSVISSNLEPVPPSGGLSRESPCYTGKLRPQKAKGRAQPQPGHPLCPSRPVPPPLRPSSRQCSTEMLEGGRLSSARTICVYTGGQHRPQKLGASCGVDQPREGLLGPTQHPGRGATTGTGWLPLATWKPPRFGWGPAWKTRGLGSCCETEAEGLTPRGGPRQGLWGLRAREENSRQELRGG